MKLASEMYNLKHNNYNLKPKNSTIYTPPEVSQFIFELLKDRLKPLHELIFDPCSGQRSLLEPWKQAGYRTFGNDIDKELYQRNLTDSNYDFFETRIRWEKSGAEFPKLVLCNPPFNGYGNKLGSEVWLDKIIELFGKDIPIVLFAPMGFRLNGKKNGRRWTKFTNDKYPPISSIISLPRDIFPEVEFHSEILIFNVKGLKGHYFYKPNHE